MFSPHESTRPTLGLAKEAGFFATDVNLVCEAEIVGSFSHFLDTKKIFSSHETTYFVTFHRRCLPQYLIFVPVLQQTLRNWT